MRRSKNHGARIYKAIIGCLLLLASQPGVRGQQQGPDTDQDKNIIRQRTSLVVVNVSVTDKQFRQISGLNKEHFEIYEDKVRQQIEFFGDDDKPASVGIIFDLSGSMNNKISRARDAIKAFIDTCHNQDDFFLVGFNERATLLAELSDGQSILNKLSLAEPRGQTALYDAAYLGVEKVKEGRHDKRAVLIVSDGQDNASRYDYGELRKLLKEADVQVYCIGIAEDGADMGSISGQAGTPGPGRDRSHDRRHGLFPHFVWGDGRLGHAHRADTSASIQHRLRPAQRTARRQVAQDQSARQRSKGAAVVGRAG